MDFPSYIRVVALSISHYFKVHVTEAGEQVLEGVEGRLLSTLSKALNFHYKHITPSEYKLGLRNESGHWSGVMGALQRKEADFAMCGIAMLFDRLEVADFSQVFNIQGLTFLVQKPDSIPGVWAFVWIYDIASWIIIVLTAIIVPLASKFLLNDKHSVIELMIEFFGSLLRQPLNFEMTSIKSNAFIAIWLMFSMVISSSFSACLLSYLSLPLRDKPITTFVELAQAVKKGTHKCFMANGAPSVYFLKNSNNKDLSFLGDTILDRKWFYKPNESINPNIVSGHAAVVNAEFSLKLLLGKLPPGSFLVSEDPLMSFKFSIALRKGFCCRERLNSVLSRISAAGLIDKYQKDEWSKVHIASIKKFPLESSVVHQLKVNDLIGAFYIFLVGILISVFIILGEIVHFHVKNK